MSPHRSFAAALGLVLLGAALLSSSQAEAQTVSATQTAAAAPTELKLSGAPRLDQRGNPRKDQYLLTARLSTADGKPLNNRLLEFSQRVELIGARDSVIGTANTDSTGTANLVFLPAQGGSQSFAVWFKGSDGYASSQASAALDLGQVEPPFEPEPLPFGLMRQWLPIGLASLVAATWVVLIGTLAVAVRDIRRAGRLLPAGGNGRVAPGGGGH
jgi:hypothetical protein